MSEFEMYVTLTHNATLLTLLPLQTFQVFSNLIYFISSGFFFTFPECLSEVEIC